MDQSNSFNLMLVGIVVIAVVTIIAVNVLTPFAIKLSERASGERDNLETNKAPATEQDSHDRAIRIVMSLIGFCMVAWLLYALVGMSVGAAPR